MPELREQLLRGLADRYVIEREIGAGGMATVYLARDIKHNRLVALKILDPELVKGTIYCRPSTRDSMWLPMASISCSCDPCARTTRSSSFTTGRPSC